jgi:putative hydroxymethylpyrimidine transport system substrate-binding protein
MPPCVQTCASDCPAPLPVSSRRVTSGRVSLGRVWSGRVWSGRAVSDPPPVRPRPKRLRAFSIAPIAASLLAGALAGSPSAVAATAPGKVLVASSRCAANRAAGTITYLTGFGWQASVGILDPITAQAQGYYSAMCLRVQLRPGNGNPTSSSQLVAAGRATVTELGSPSDAITAAAAGIPIDAVATYGNTTASTLLTMPSITNLRQLDGKTIGYKGAMPPIITAMLEKAGVNTRSLKEVEVGYDPTILPRGQVQGLTAYKSNEPIELKDDGYKIHEWDPGVFGLNGAFNVFDANRAWATAHPGAMEDFLRATFEAYDYCLAHASTCVKEAAHYQTGYLVQQNIQRWHVESGEVNSTLLAGHGVGYEDRAQWEPEYKLLLADHLIRHPVALPQIINPTYINAIYNGHSLIWPGP